MLVAYLDSLHPKRRAGTSCRSATARSTVMVEGDRHVEMGEHSAACRGSAAESAERTGLRADADASQGAAPHPVGLSASSAPRGRGRVARQRASPAVTQRRRNPNLRIRRYSKIEASGAEMERSPPSSRTEACTWAMLPCGSPRALIFGLGMADVFFSYKREDRTRIEPLVLLIESEGLTVWWDPSLVAGRALRSSDHREIERLLRHRRGR